MTKLGLHVSQFVATNKVPSFSELGFLLFFNLNAFPLPKGAPPFHRYVIITTKDIL